MSEHSVPTVRVVAPVTEDNPHGYVVINASDQTDAHETFSDAPAQTGRPARAERRSQTGA